MSKQVFKLPEGLPNCLAAIAGHQGEGCVELKPWRRDRSLNQNALSHAWYAQVSRETREDTPEGIKRFCKYTFGLPILRADDPSINADCEAIIDPIPYEQGIRAMRLMDVTSLMTTAQMAEYLEAVQAYYVGLNVNLEFPNDY